MRAMWFMAILAWAQTEQPPPPTALENSGKPMRVAFACTGDDIQWAGMSCSEDDPCPMYLELSAVEAVGNRLFTIGNIHSSSVTLYSILLASEDAGATWREPFERARGAGLDHMQFLDFQNGWISGETFNPLPRDPFLLITSDGGRNWRRVPVSEESRGGIIQQFWFEAKDRGSLVVDRMQSAESGRYELYESPNGGNTWMIRQTSDRPLSIRASASANADLRVRPDAASQSFVIEKRQGERWNKVASFLVPIGDCKPPEKREAEPPPETLAPPPAPAVIQIKPPSLKRSPPK